MIPKIHTCILSHYVTWERMALFTARYIRKCHPPGEFTLTKDVAALRPALESLKSWAGSTDNISVKKKPAGKGDRYGCAEQWLFEYCHSVEQRREIGVSSFRSAISLFAQNRMHRRQQRHTALVIPCTCMDRWIGCVDCDIVRSRNWGARKWAGTPECQY
jgi:hypothetical protein